MRKMSEQRAQYLAQSSNEPRQLKCGVLHECYFVLTKDPLAAMVLNQFVYWSQRTNDFDRFIKEENARRLQENDSEIPLTNGWIYKTSADMSDEIMLGSESSVRRAIIQLVENGWLDERNNPNHKWDRTLQYRVNLIKLIQELAAIGYTVPNYRFDLSILQGDATIPHGESSNPRHDAALPENTIKTTTDKEIAPIQNIGAPTLHNSQTPRGGIDPAKVYVPKSIRDSSDKHQEKKTFEPITKLGLYLKANSAWPGFKTNKARIAWGVVELSDPDRLKRAIDWALGKTGLPVLGLDGKILVAFKTMGTTSGRLTPDLPEPTPADKEKMKADYIKESKRILMGKGMPEAEAQREAEKYWIDWSTGRI